METIACVTKIYIVRIRTYLLISWAFHNPPITNTASTAQPNILQPFIVFPLSSAD